MKLLFIDFMLEVAEVRKESRATNTVRNYQAAISQFECYLGERKNSIGIEDVDSKLIEEYEKYLLKVHNVKKNTSSAYLRPLRCMYNLAVEQGLCNDRHPFRCAYLGIDKTRKRAVKLDELKKVFALRLKEGSELELYRDIFAFSFFTHGMAFVDIAKLRMDDICNGEIRYMRSKTHKPIRVRIDCNARCIIDKHHVDGDVYVFPLFDDGFSQREYDTVIHKYNRLLDELSQMAGLDCKLTTYCARHSWASIAYKEKVPVSVISTCLGHSTEEMTRIYLQGIDDGEVDEECEKVSELFGNMF